MFSAVTLEPLDVTLFDCKYVVSIFKGFGCGDSLQTVCMHVCMQVLQFYRMCEETWMYWRFLMNEHIVQ